MRLFVYTSLADERCFTVSYQSKLLGNGGCKHTQEHRDFCVRSDSSPSFSCQSGFPPSAQEERISCSQSNNDNFYAVRQSPQRAQNKARQGSSRFWYEKSKRGWASLWRTPLQHCSAPLWWRISMPALLPAGKGFLCVLRRLKVTASVESASGHERNGKKKKGIKPLYHTNDTGLKSQDCT